MLKLECLFIEPLSPRIVGLWALAQLQRPYLFKGIDQYLMCIFPAQTSLTLVVLHGNECSYIRRDVDVFFVAEPQQVAERAEVKMENKNVSPSIIEN